MPLFFLVSCLTSRPVISMLDRGWELPSPSAPSSLQTGLKLLRYSLRVASYSSLLLLTPHIPLCRYIIVVEHDLSVLDYLSDFICCLYGVPSAYGVVTMPFSVREGTALSKTCMWCSETSRFYRGARGCQAPRTESKAPLFKAVFMAFYCRFGKLSSALWFALWRAVFFMCFCSIEQCSQSQTHLFISWIRGV